MGRPLISCFVSCSPHLSPQMLHIFIVPPLPFTKCTNDAATAGRMPFGFEMPVNLYAPPRVIRRPAVPALARGCAARQLNASGTSRVVSIENPLTVRRVLRFVFHTHSLTEIPPFVKGYFSVLIFSFFSCQRDSLLSPPPLDGRAQSLRDHSAGLLLVHWRALVPAALWETPLQ